MKIKVGIIGALGHAGEELIKILLKHPYVNINYLADRLSKPQVISGIFPEFKGILDIICDNFDAKEALRLCDLFFLALPHTASLNIAPLLLKGKGKVIDLSADYRLKAHKSYEAWYKVKHTDKENLKKAVYGLPELYTAKIKKADFIANPGCYPTAALLALAPIAKKSLFRFDNIIIDAKSGYSGAGRKSLDDPFRQEVKDDFKAYKVDNHQHSPEINQELSVLTGKKINVTFVPHLLPIERGILETIYVQAKDKKLKSAGVIKLYKDFYKDKPFVRIKKEGEFPRIKDVSGTNFCDIGIKVGRENLIIISAIDNLVKGASGQAVQNMNLMCGFKEIEGLL